MKCPKCAFENRDRAAECGRCGVIFAKAAEAGARRTNGGMTRVPTSPAGPRMQPAVEGSRAEKRAERRRRSVLGKLEPLISHILEEDETVLDVACAMSRYNFAELMTTGWIIAYLKRCVLVFTDRRILQVLTDPSYRSRGSWAEIRWADVRDFKASAFFGKLDLAMRDGTKQRFTGIPRKDAKQLDALIESRVGTGEQSHVGGKTFHCPRCSAGLSAGQARCMGCDFEFKNVERATWLSILVPGGGYFYTGHPLMGLGDLLVESYLILMILLFAFGVPEPGVDGVGIALFLTGFLVFEKLITIYHARHYVSEFIPAGARGGWKKKIAEPTVASRQTGVRASRPISGGVPAAGATPIAQKTGTLV